MPGGSVYPLIYFTVYLSSFRRSLQDPPRGRPSSSRRGRPCAIPPTVSRPCGSRVPSSPAAGRVRTPHQVRRREFLLPPLLQRDKAGKHASGDRGRRPPLVRARRADATRDTGGGQGGEAADRRKELLLPPLLRRDDGWKNTSWVTATVGGAATTDPAAIEGVRGGVRPPPPRTVEAEGRRHAGGPAHGVARQNRRGRSSDSFRGERREEPQTRDIPHLSDVSKA